MAKAKQRKTSRVKTRVGCNQPGTVVVFDESLLNEDYWNSISEKERIKRYGHLGYGADRKRLFVFLCEINHSGHCVLVALDNQEVLTMVHTDILRPATEEEF